MRFFFELGDRFAKESSWKDFAMTKFCLCAIGVLLGVNVPEKYRKVAIGTMLPVFAATYIPLMSKIFAIAGKMLKERREF